MPCAMCDVLTRTARSGHKGLLVQKQGAYKPNKHCAMPLFYATVLRSMCSDGIGGGGDGGPARVESPETERLAHLLA